MNSDLHLINVRQKLMKKQIIWRNLRVLKFTGMTAVTGISAGLLDTALSKPCQESNVDKTNLKSESSLARQNICRDFQRISCGEEKEKMLGNHWKDFLFIHLFIFLF